MKELRRQKTRRGLRMKTRRLITEIIIGTLIGTSLMVMIDHKANHKIVCDIECSKDGIVWVQHPNGCVYTYQSQLYGEYKGKAEVTFDELTDWEKNYSVKKIELKRVSVRRLSQNTVLK